MSTSHDVVVACIIALTSVTTVARAQQPDGESGVPADDEGAANQEDAGTEAPESTAAEEPAEAGAPAELVDPEPARAAPVPPQIPLPPPAHPRAVRSAQEGSPEPLLDPPAVSYHPERWAGPASGFFMELRWSPAAAQASGSIFSIVTTQSFVPSLYLGGITDGGLGAGVGLSLSYSNSVPIYLGYPYGGYGSATMWQASLTPTIVYLGRGWLDGAIRPRANGGLVVGLVEAEGIAVGVVGFEAGGGASFFPHPVFGIGLLAGLRGMGVPEAGQFDLVVDIALTVTVIFDAGSSSSELTSSSRVPEAAAHSSAAASMQ